VTDGPETSDGRAAGEQAAANERPAGGLATLLGPHPRTPQLLRWEIFVVFAISLGASGLNAALDLINSLLQSGSLSSQQALLVGSRAPNHWLDLVLQLVGIAEALTPVALVIYLLIAGGERPREVLGIDGSQPGTDALRGAALAALIGGSGLGLYLIAYNIGVSLNVVPESLPAIWWRIPVLILSATHDGVLEEIVVLGYLIHRLTQLEWSPWKAIAFSAFIRGSYHLYQGLGGFVGNAIMGVIFGYLYKRWGRVTPMIIAHTLIDTVTFVGYAALHNRVSWLP
jgi:membrane protease YdiL (CAAX protease family)